MTLIHKFNGCVLLTGVGIDLRWSIMNDKFEDTCCKKIFKKKAKSDDASGLKTKPRESRN